METKKVVKKPSGFKDTLKRSWKKFCNFMKKKYDKFMKLPKYIRIITYVWLIVLLLLIIVIFGSVINNKAQAKYKTMEDKMAEAATKFAQENSVYGSQDSKNKVSLDLLIDRHYMSEDDKANKTCTGFVIVYYNDADQKIESKPYINCKRYTTKDYKEYVDVDKEIIKREK